MRGRQTYLVSMYELPIVFIGYSVDKATSNNNDKVINHQFNHMYCTASAKTCLSYIKS